MYFCPLLLISSVLLGSYHFCPLLCLCLHEMFPWYLLIFLKGSLVFFTLLFSSVSLHGTLRKAFLSLLAILWNSAFRWVYLSFSLYPSLFFFSQLFVRPPQTAILVFCISFSWGLFLSPPSAVLQTSIIVLQALCLRSHPLNLFVTSTVKS